MIRPKAVRGLKVLKQYHTGGHQPLLVQCDDQNKYVIKQDQGTEPPMYIIREFIACFLLENWKIPVPPCAFIKMANKELDANPVFQKPEHLAHYYRHKYCFGSQYIEKAILVEQANIGSGKKAFKAIKNPKDVLRVFLFDHWTVNEDRSTTNYNLLLIPDRTGQLVVAIDHAFIFGEDHQGFSSEFFTFVLKHSEVNAVFIQQEREYFKRAMALCQHEFDSFIEVLQEYFTSIELDQIKYLKGWLFKPDRLDMVFEEYRKALLSPK